MRGEAPYYAQGLRNLECKGASSVRAEGLMRIRRASTYIITLNIEEENSSILRHYSPMLCKAPDALDDKVLPSVWYVQGLMLFTLDRGPSIGLLVYVHCLMLLTPRVLPCVCSVQCPDALDTRVLPICPVSARSVAHQGSSESRFCSGVIDCRILVSILRDVCLWTHN